MVQLTKEQMLKLFFHRSDVFSTQQENGAYFPTKRSPTLEDIQKHLDGKITMGAYCLRQDNTIMWACVDLDGSDLRQMKKEADHIYELFPPNNYIKGRILEFSGRRGYHVWVFFKHPVPAEFGQKLVKARLNTIGMLKYEVFPKQTELNENRKYGNLVKIPHALHRVSGKRSEILKMEGIE